MKRVAVLLIVAFYSLISFGQIEYLGEKEVNVYDIKLIRLNDCSLKLLEYSDYTFNILNLDNSVYQTVPFDTVGLNIGSGEVSMYTDARYTTSNLVDSDAGIEIVVQYLMRSSSDKSIFYVLDDDGKAILKVEDSYTPTSDWDYLKSSSTYSIMAIDSLDDYTKMYKLPGVLPTCSAVSDLELALDNNVLSLSNGSEVSLEGYVNTDNQQLAYSNDTVYLSNGGWIYIGEQNSTAIEANIVGADIAESTIYPNPTSTLAYLNYDLNGEMNGTLNIYDAKGVLVIATALFDSKGVEEINVDLLSAGTYFYSVKTTNGSSRLCKLTICN